MNLSEITPVVLTWNEEANIARCLDALGWADQVIVVDSGSSDATREICGRFARVRVIDRAFDSHAGQTNFGISQVRTPWVLALDADYILPGGFQDEVAGLDEAGLFGFRARFDYCVFGRALRGTLYPPRVVLHRVADAEYWQDGHAHRLRIGGRIGEIHSKIAHDDRKSLLRWHAAQATYARLEAEKLISARVSDLSQADRLRKRIWFAPWAIVIWCLVMKGCVLDGLAGSYYAMQRFLAEWALSLELLDRRLRKGGDR